MTASFYDLSVPTYLQTVSAVAEFLERTAGHCAEQGFSPDRFVTERLFVDMAAFHFQIECVSHHSYPALEAMRTGVFDPPGLRGAVPFAELQAMTAATVASLKALEPEAVNSWAGKALDLQIGPRRLAFTSETFFLSFSLPNVHFHAAMAYAILRTNGVPLGKRDYEGVLRTATP